VILPEPTLIATLPAGALKLIVAQGPAGYSFGNLVKPGWPVTVVVAAVALLIAPLAYRF